MPKVNIGLDITASPVTALYGSAATYVVSGLIPNFIADFSSEYYRTDAGIKTFEDTIAYTGASNKTMVDSDGLLKWAPHNLLSYSEDFTNAAWTKTRCTITANQAAAPDGSATADLMEATDADARLDQVAGVQDVYHTQGIWVKAAQSGTVAGQIDFSGLHTQAFTANDTWQHITSELTTGGVTPRCRVRITNSGDKLYVWGAHLYRSDLGGMVANPDRGDSYVPTTTAARYLPRRGHHVYNGSARVNEGLLVESEARTNLLTYSQDFTNPVWTEAGNLLAFSSPSAIGPDGETSATLFVDDSSGGGIGFPQAICVAAVTSAVNHTFSCYLKANQLSFGALRTNLFDASANGFTYFNLSTGVVTSKSANHSSATIQDAGNGWYRCSITFQSTTDLLGVVVIQISQDGATTGVDLDGTSSILIYGAQLEAGSTPSSYIPTSGATVTRAAETLTVAAADLPYPTPRVIGPELVTNGTFDTDSDWTKGTGWTISGGLASKVSGTGSGISTPISLVGGKVYQVDYSVLNYVSGTIRPFFTGGTSVSGESRAANGNFSDILVANAGNIRIEMSANLSFVGSIDNISVREIDPLSVSIQMQGRMTYADEGAFHEIFTWGDDATTGTNGIQHYLDTRLSETGQIVFRQEAANVVDAVGGPADSYSPGIFVPFNISGRHGSTFVNGAVDGVSLTATPTPVALPDLSARNLTLGTDYMGTIRLYRMWGQDLGDTGIAEASGLWLLSGGIWDDKGYWRDAATWNDGV